MLLIDVIFSTHVIFEPMSSYAQNQKHGINGFCTNMIYHGLWKYNTKIKLNVSMVYLLFEWNKKNSKFWKLD
jgi:hypothetical protein